MPQVICIAGRLAAGKTTLVRSLARELGASALLFDEYQDTCDWPPDLNVWLAAGADTSMVSNARLSKDLAALVTGESVRHPLTDKTIEATDLILLEDPFGRTRPDTASLIDHVLFVDLPSDLSVVRLMQRGMNVPSLDTAASEIEQLSKDEATQRLLVMRLWLANYLALREMYVVVSDRVRDSSDHVLDSSGLQEELLAEALQIIRKL